MSESQATVEASRRLGDARTLVKKTVREYQRRYWCGRWPLVTYLFGPTCVVVLCWLATFVGNHAISWIARACGLDRFLLRGDEAMVMANLFTVWGFYVVPVVVVMGFAWLASRSALGSGLVWLAAATLGITVGMMEFDVQRAAQGTGGSLTMSYPLWFIPEYSQSLLWESHFANPHQLCRMLLPAAGASIVLIYLLLKKQSRERLLTRLC